MIFEIYAAWKICNVLFQKQFLFLPEHFKKHERHFIKNRLERGILFRFAYIIGSVSRSSHHKNSALN